MLPEKLETTYVGRFAPSPSGSLHFGSLLTAFASYIDAKAHNGLWLLRIDNIDPPREIEGACENIVSTMEQLGLLWDKSVIYQGDRIKFYVDQCVNWIEQDLVYPCYCSRKELTRFEQYPNTCRKILSANEKQKLINNLLTHYQRLDTRHTLTDHYSNIKLNSYALRLNTAGLELEQLDFVDQIFGAQKLPNNFGDFIIFRKDNLPSYMLACALDELNLKITHIVRGSDLITSTFWQRAIQSTSQGKPATIEFSHLPLLVNTLGQKLSKQHHSPEIDLAQKELLLFKVLFALKQNPDPALLKANCEEIIQWGITHWNPSLISTDNISFDELMQN